MEYVYANGHIRFRNTLYNKIYTYKYRYFSVYVFIVSIFVPLDRLPYIVSKSYKDGAVGITTPSFIDYADFADKSDVCDGGELAMPACLRKLLPYGPILVGVYWFNEFLYHTIYNNIIKPRRKSWWEEEGEGTF